MLSINNLSLAYDNKSIIIHELNLEIEEGSIVALVGPNGCGKSTLLRGISRLLKPKMGQVYLNGRDIHTLPAKKLAQELGILPQSPTAPDGLTVYELVSQGRYPYQSWYKQWSTTDEQIVEEALHSTNLTMFAQRAVDTLSGGQRQRAWIALALVQQTKILLLDEPTTYLDLAYQIDVLDLLSELNQAGRTIIMVLHDLNQAARYADKLIMLRGGQIISQGNPLDVMTSDILLEVFGLNAHVMPDPISGLPMCIPIGRQSQYKMIAKTP